MKLGSKPSMTLIRNLARLLFAPWCEHCVATRSREHAHKKCEIVRRSNEESSKTVVDFAYTSTSTLESPSLVMLVACNSWSKTFCVVSVERRGGAGKPQTMFHLIMQGMVLQNVQYRQQEGIVTP